MTVGRRVVCVLVAAVLCAAGSQPIFAATKRKPAPKPAKPVCNLLPAATGTNKSSDPNMNITSGDIATNATTLTWTLRLTSVSTSTDNNAPMGIEWSYWFQAAGKPVTLSMVSGPFGIQDGSRLNATVKVDQPGKRVLYTVPLANLAKPPLQLTIVNHKTVLSQMKGYASGAIEYPAATNEEPTPFGASYTTTSGATYTAGTSSCLVVGS